jgi:predicted nucleic acid-binding protein
MGMKVNLDTNIFIAVKNKESNFEYSKQILDRIEDKTLNAVISTVVFMEVLVGFYQNNEKDEANSFSNKILLNYDLITVDPEIAIEAAKIRAKFGIKLPDAIIAASTLLSECDYFITNDKPLLEKLDIKKITPKKFVEKFLN